MGPGWASPETVRPTEVLAAISSRSQSLWGGPPGAPPRIQFVLSERQELILQLAVDAYLASAKPVASRELAELREVEWGPSTVRAELAALEMAGYLTHPHTSAGRVPTDSGYRRYVDLLLESGALPAEARVGLELSRLRREVDEAMRETTAALAQVTDLVAMATAPSPSVAATIHRVEVLRLQPTKVVVIAIASTGDVARRVFEFDQAVDPGLVEWASSYLNESLAELGVGSRMISGRLADPELDRVEAEFVATLGSAFTELERETATDLYMDGASRLLSEEHLADLPRADELMTALERRAGVLQMLRSSLEERSVFLWIGDENPQPELRSVSVVGANYGLGHRNLGSVGVVGPLRMDYATAIASVRGAARELSRYFETVYDG
ncbi:MAG TPA: heat-inducible transcriptional repressor HrcA [Solirubrobacterales bacterium]|nr:heat-inducible transcriptional repressor HrcA [Solirubrobacterales bacterium]